MTTCELVRARFDRRLDRELTGEERRLVAEHLGAECAACATWLADADAGELLVALAGAAAELSDVERQRMLAAVLPPAPRRRRPLWVASGLAVVAAAAAAFLLIPRPARDGWTGEKGTGVAPVVLSVRPIVGSVESGRPRVLRDWAGGAPLAAGEVMLFRLALDRPAHVYLVAGDGRVLHEAPAPAGEHELTAGGLALALDPRTLGADRRLSWIAAPGPIDRATVIALGRGPAVVCPSCGIVELTVPAP